MFKAEHTFNDIIGYGELKAKARRLAKEDFNLLIIGETGVGKDTFAEAIHNESNRKQNPFVEIHCSCIPATLFETELFGHNKGSYTDAKESSDGLIQKANHGTLFFNEMGDMPIDFQKKLLHFLEYKKYIRIGSNQEYESNSRFIFSTNANLQDKIKKGEFRQDLFYRISSYCLEIPPLRQRKNDIEEIAQFYWKKNNHNNLPKRLDNHILKILMQYDFPGNIRELINILTKAHIELESNPDLDLTNVIKNELLNSFRSEESGGNIDKKNINALFYNLIEGNIDFWKDVYNKFCRHEISKEHFRMIIFRGLDCTRSRKISELLQIFHIDRKDYKKVADMLRYHRILEQERR
jgi:transcriptional regulator with PAS, ATPase and Fis domain